MFTKDYRPPFAIAQKIDLYDDAARGAMMIVRGRNGLTRRQKLMLLKYYVEYKWCSFKLRGEFRRAIREQSLARTKMGMWE